MAGFICINKIEILQAGKIALSKVFLLHFGPTFSFLSWDSKMSPTFDSYSMVLRI
jgi:hypothetical protein